MIDSVLKGTGNSRFLKSAVPPGTSWADALAMLQAGTFPIDFNGINTEGFQQVGTPLNKANLLKDATAAQIGLPPSTTPDGMFQALGNTGELHVWRKTVKNAADVPAGYTITDKTGVGSGVSNSARITISYSDAVDVDDQGNVSLREPITTETYSVPGLNQLGATNPTYISGKFFTATTYKGIMYRKPSVSWVFGHDDDGTYFHGGFVVKGYAKVFAGTTTTYPVSTNPKAYQEGDDAKAAGYVVGEVESGQFSLGVTVDSSAINRYNYSSAIAVNDDGTISLLSSSPIEINGGQSAYNNDAMAKIIGKYIALERVGDSNHSPDFDAGVVWFIPTDATYGNKGSYPNNINYVTKRQPVTGYAAIPAGTAIEYLGKLGDKARVQVVSYVGTGTYGSDNPVSITFDFVPKSIWVIGRGYSYDSEVHLMHGDTSKDSGKVYYFAFSRISWESKTVSWYNTSQSGSQASALQANTLGETYKVLAIG